MGWSSRITGAANKYLGRRQGSAGGPTRDRGMATGGRGGTKGAGGSIGGMIRRALKKR